MSAVTAAQVISLRVDAVDYGSATTRILAWARQAESRYVCHANVHMVMEAFDDPSFAHAVNGADLVTADGVPLVWALRAKGISRQTRVYGPTLMLRLLAAASVERLPVGFYGSSEATLRLLLQRVKGRYPELEVAFARSPPYLPGEVGSEEDDRDIAASGARLLFIGLGCPKQERWMAARKGRLPCVMLGVGAAFDFHAGTVRQAPELLQRLGLEWAFRASMEPRRLLRRYARTNPRFIALITRELLAERLGWSAR